MDPVSLMDQIKAEIENGSAAQNANLAIVLFKSSSKNTELGVVAGFAAVLAFQKVIAEKVDAVDAKLDTLLARIGEPAA